MVSKWAHDGTIILPQYLPDFTTFEDDLRDEAESYPPSLGRSTVLDFQHARRVVAEGDGRCRGSR